MQDPSELVVAQFDPGLLLEVLPQVVDRPDAETEAEILGFTIAFRVAARYSGVARETRPGGLDGVRPAIP